MIGGSLLAGITHRDLHLNKALLLITDRLKIKEMVSINLKISLKHSMPNIAKSCIWKHAETITSTQRLPKDNCHFFHPRGLF